MSLRTSDSVKVIAAALLKVQTKLEAVHKTADNPYFKSKYADLNSVMEAVKGPLNEQGIVILQFPDENHNPDAPTLALTTRLQHTSGEYVEATASVPLAKSDPQGFGSAVTYARRYSLQSILALLAEDDDAEGAVDHGANSTRSLPSTKPAAAKPKGIANPGPTGGFVLGRNGGPHKAVAAPKRGKTGIFPTEFAAGVAGGGEVGDE